MGIEAVFVGDEKNIDPPEAIGEGAKISPMIQDVENPRAGGVLTEKSCCGVPVVQSEGAHEIGGGMYVGGLIMDYCPKCHKPYHSPVIGSVQ